MILVALGADYNIFIMSRIREEADAGHEIHHAVTRGLTLTGKVITSAGLILAGTFAALLVAPLPNLRQIGFGVAVGILIDPFLVRSLLVPAATMLLGRLAFWPRTPRSTNNDDPRGADHLVGTYRLNGSETGARTAAAKSLTTVATRMGPFVRR